MIKKIPSKKEYEIAYDMLKAKKFPVLIHLSDVLNRYIDIRFKNKIEWLKINALMILTIKGGSINLSQLSNTMVRPKWTITKLVDAMESDGWVIRVRSKKDRRSILVMTTQSGLATLNNFLTLCDQAENETMAFLDKSDTDTLEIICRLLIERLVEVTSNYHDSLFYFHRGIFYKALGRKEAALTNLKRSLETAKEKPLIRMIRQEIDELESPT